MLFKASEWRITGSSGGSLTVGTPVARIQLGGSRLNLPIANLRTKEIVKLNGYGGGASVGVSLETPLSDIGNLSISTEDMPSDGIDVIYRKDDNGRAYSSKDFTGALTVISGGVTVAAISGEICVALWQKYPLAECLVDGWSSCDVFSAVSNAYMMLNPLSLPAGMAQATHAIGLFSGVSAVTDVAAAGVTVFTYVMSA